MSASRIEMVDPGMSDRVWTRIMRTLIDTGRPPHYAELARGLGVSPAESRAILSRWYPERATERREDLARIGKASPFWLGTPSPPA